MKAYVCVHTTGSQTDRQILPSNYVHSTVELFPSWNTVNEVALQLNYNLAGG